MLCSLTQHLRLFLISFLFLLIWTLTLTIDDSRYQQFWTDWNCFLDFVVEHWFGCGAAESGFAGDIGAIEVCLIDLLIKSTQQNWNSNMTIMTVTSQVSLIFTPPLVSKRIFSKPSKPWITGHSGHLAFILLWYHRYLERIPLWMRRLYDWQSPED